jgi:hypothetical protein
MKLVNPHRMGRMGRRYTMSPIDKLGKSRWVGLPHPFPRDAVTVALLSVLGDRVVLILMVCRHLPSHWVQTSFRVVGSYR